MREDHAQIFYFFFNDSDTMILQQYFILLEQAVNTTLTHYLSPYKVVMADGLAHKSLFTLECSPGRIFLSESVETAYSPNSTGVPLLMSGHTVVTMVAKVLFSAHIVDILTYQLRELESTMSIDK